MGKLMRAWRQVRWSVGHRGVVETAKVSALRVLGLRRELEQSVHPFDAAYGVDTSGQIGGGVLGVGHANDRFIVAYYGVQPSRLKQAISKWSAMEGTRSLSEVGFIDIGAGKGRAMMIASEFGFREVFGVEMNPELHAVALQNFEMWKQAGRAASGLRMKLGDATEIALPDGPLLVFFYNPFHAPVMRRMLQTLVARGGAMDVLYMVPEAAEVFAEFPQMKLMWSEVLAMSPEDEAADLVSTPDDRCNCYRFVA